MPDELNQNRKYLDDNERFGFMRRSRGANCRTCGMPIKPDDSRFWDNQYKRGPICQNCAGQAVRNADPGINDALDTHELRIKRLEDFIRDMTTISVGSVSKFDQFIKTWKPKQ